MTSRRGRNATMALVILMTSFSDSASAQGGSASATSARDSAEIARVVLAYRTALADGDSATALSLLAPDAIVLESGDIETREDYRRHHLPADIEFARAVRSAHMPVRVAVQGNAGWAWSSSATDGELRGRRIRSAGAELMVLSRRADGRWLIRAIHWSSRSRPTRPQ